jgi:hypothetical protein
MLSWRLVYTKNFYISERKTFRFDRHSRLAAKRQAVKKPFFFLFFTLLNCFILVLSQANF